MESLITKNDKIWDVLFKQNNILEEISKNGYYEITAEQIKKAGREPRLMTKFDSKENLPTIFQDNNLAILPTKRGSYVIGHFNNYIDITIDNNIDVATMHLPNYITTIDYKNINSEAISLSAAYISKMIEDVVGEEVVPTIQGRMGTGEFSFNIDLLDKKSNFEINVKNSQMEIDGSYEGESKFVIIEAKNHHMNDFIVRQLYYPYRVWKKITNKEIIPIMLIKHNNIFNFYVYDFENENSYNSIVLKKVKRYILDEVYNPIEIDDLINVYNNIEIIDEDPKCPFPQANDFHKVLDLVEELSVNEMNASEVSDYFMFVQRQANYYIVAGKYLGLIKKNHKRYCLTELGKNIVTMPYKYKNLELVKIILKHKPFYYAFSKYLEDNDYDRKRISQLIKDNNPRINKNSTAFRRTSTVKAWIDWIFELSITWDEYKIDN